jgi:hypothetical protein
LTKGKVKKKGLVSQNEQHITRGGSTAAGERYSIILGYITGARGGCKSEKKAEV